MATIELDIAYQDSLESTLASIPADMGVTCRVVQSFGPGGGWPVIEFHASDSAAIERFVREWYAEGDESIVRDVLEG